MAKWLVKRNRDDATNDYLLPSKRRLFEALHEKINDNKQQLNGENEGGKSESIYDKVGYNNGRPDELDDSNEKYKYFPMVNQNDVFGK